MHSLQTRLSSGLIITLSILVGAMLIIGSYALRHLAEEFVATRLEHDMDALLVALSFDDKGRPVLDSTRLSPVFRQPYSGHYYTLQANGVVLRSRSLWDTDLALPAGISHRLSRYSTSGPQAQDLLVLARTFRLRGHAVKIGIAEDFTPLGQGLRRLTIGFMLLALLVLGMLILIQRLMVRRSLKPLEDTRRDILRLAQGEVRHLQTDVPTEVQPLVEEINRLITLLGERLQRSRHALGNLAHALKTPLTVLTQLTEHNQTQAELQTELGRQTRQIRTLIDRELKRARIAGTPIPGQRIVLVKEIEDLLATLKKIYPNKTLSIETHIASSILFPGDRDDLLELLGNLLDNAYQWAVSRVRLTAQTNRLLRLSVEDDGPGCDPEQLAYLTQRGARIDESRAGHGLGLAIVSDIVQQYGGRLELGLSAQLGGFKAVVELPYRDG